MPNPTISPAILLSPVETGYVAYDPVGDRLHQLNPVAALLAEIAVGTAPRSLAIAPNGRVWVTNKLAGTVSVIDPATLGVVQILTLPFASQPFGVLTETEGANGETLVRERTGNRSLVLFARLISGLLEPTDK